MTELTFQKHMKWTMKWNFIQTKCAVSNSLRNSALQLIAGKLRCFE